MVGLAALCASLPLFADSVPRVAPETAGLSSGKLAEVDAFMNRQVENAQIAGGVVGVIHQGRVATLRAYGKQDLETGWAMQTDTIFRIYSMTKAITSAAALTLVEDKKLDLDAPVAKYLPQLDGLQVATEDGLRAPERAPTVRDLFLHTAGFTYGSGPEPMREAWSEAQPMAATSTEDFIRRLAQVPLAFDPGTRWVYGVSIDVLGRVIEVVSGQSLDTYFQQAIFDPLGMEDTGFHLPADKIERFAVNYRRSDEGLQVVDPRVGSRYSEPAGFLSGGGGLVGTVPDYLTFLSMIANGGDLGNARILKPETVALMHTNQLPEEAYPISFGAEIREGVGFGLGFNTRDRITEIWDPDGHVGEYGWGGAASTHYWVSPEDDLIVVTMEQIMPYQWDTEFGLKKILYDAIAD